MSSVASEVGAGLGISPAKSRQGSLLGSRHIDFWFLGGLSLLLWMPMYFLLKSSTALQTLGAALPAGAFFLATWINQPHFMASYKLAYTQGTGFVRQNWIQLVAVPIVMLALLAMAYLYWDTVITDSAVVSNVNTLLAAIGLNTRIGLSPTLGSELLSYFVHFMYFTVGWHYSKQTFGCMMVYSRFDGYALSTWHRNVLRYGLLSTWWVSWMYSQCSPGSYDFYGLTIHRFNLPYAWFQATYVIVGLMFAAIVLGFTQHYRRHRQLPSLNFLIPMLALLTWHVPLFGQPEFFIVIALFHSLQYFPFVAKVESSRYKKQQRKQPALRLLGFFGIMVALGYATFVYVPGLFDRAAQTLSLKGTAFFLVGFVLFINIHHYFIDNVLWRFKSKDVRELLLN